MVSLADFQPRAKTNFPHQQRDSTDGYFIASKLMQELRIGDLLRDSASFHKLKFRVKYSQSHNKLSTNIDRHLQLCLHLLLMWTNSVRLIRVFPQMNKADSIYLMCRSLVLRHTLYGSFSTDSQQYLRLWVCCDWNYKSAKARRFKVMFDL